VCTGYSGEAFRVYALVMFRGVKPLPYMYSSEKQKRQQGCWRDKPATQNYPALTIHEE
jgi:hypothetical protein